MDEQHERSKAKVQCSGHVSTNATSIAFNHYSSLTLLLFLILCPLAWPKEFLDSVDHIADNIVQNMLLSETELECKWPTTVCVGDLQPFNILRRTDVSSELVFIDFQLCLLGEGHTDIGYFLAWVLSPKDRKQHEGVFCGSTMIRW